MFKNVFLILFYVIQIILPTRYIDNLNNKNIIYQDNTQINLLDFNLEASNYFDQLFLTNLQNNKFTELFIDINDDITNLSSIDISFAGYEGNLVIDSSNIDYEGFYINLFDVNAKPLEDEKNYKLRIKLILPTEIWFDFDYLFTNPDPYFVSDEITVTQVSDTSVTIDFWIYKNSSLTSLNVKLGSIITNVSLVNDTDAKYSLTFDNLIPNKTYIPQFEMSWNNAYYGNENATYYSDSFILGSDELISKNDSKGVFFWTMISITIILIILIVALIAIIFVKKRK